MVQLIKKGGLRERANRSRSYKGSENTESTLKPNRYREHLEQTETVTTDEPQKQDLSDSKTTEMTQK
ncbi:hypothetical protein B9T33_05775 [Acinetobacter sp. ANC 5054]|uniref:hypothetical protein n=1 Tax=Acinetobacter sp. ANC 5054 TaxID=1977877 RepID=UPI000A33F631|nr:hypothetical protein [Acinetobacter sp. ANC 5054]OTG82028.1 hypothetical protein B9T33_05775 [Acinetobacter sp. ANC 5054]